MRFFAWWVKDNDGLERAKRADAEADLHLRESREVGRWARTMLDRDDFADALVHIIQGGTS